MVWRLKRMRRRRLLQIFALAVAASAMPFGTALATAPVQLASMAKGHIEIIYPSWMRYEKEYIEWRKESFANPKVFPEPMTYSLMPGDEIKITVTGLKNGAEIQERLECELEEWSADEFTMDEGEGDGLGFEEDEEDGDN
jgi:hypothetical protein